jgi:phage RecT family recombinase
MANTQIAVTDEYVVATVQGWANQHLRPFYHGRDFSGWLADAALAIAQNKSLRDCLTNDMDKIVFVRSLQLNASSGLSLSPQKGEAALVPYRGKNGLAVTHMTMKNGLVKLAMKTGKILKIESGTVYENDVFKPKKSSAGDGYDWEIAVENRGAPRGYFSLVKLADGTGVLEYQTRAQVMEHALKYGNGRVWDEHTRKYKNEFYPESAWGKSFDGMAEKTVIRAVLGGLYLPELEEILEAEQEPERDVTEPQPRERGASAEDIEAKLAAQAADDREAGHGSAAAPERGPDQALEGNPGQPEIF